jgi:hypothetical protein
VRRIQRINHQPVECDMDSSPESISDTEDWLNWNGDYDNPNDSEHDCAADCECVMDQDNSIEDSECSEHRGVSHAPNVPGLIRLIRKSKRHAENMWVTFSAIEIRRNKGVKNR